MEEEPMQKIVTNLWFDTQAEEAAWFYTSLFSSGSVDAVTYYDAAGAEISGRPEGSVLTVSFTLDGQQFIALNGGPLFQFTPAISLMINCETQEEIDRLWDAFCEEGEPSQCGWVTDKYGLSWQIVPNVLNELLLTKDPEQAARVNQAMYRMQKLVISELVAAYYTPKAE